MNGPGDPPLSTAMGVPKNWANNATVAMSLKVCTSQLWLKHAETKSLKKSSIRFLVAFSARKAKAYIASMDLRPQYVWGPNGLWSSPLVGCRVFMGTSEALTWKVPSNQTQWQPEIA